MALVILVLWRLWQPPEAPLPDSLAPGVYQVQRAVDGDTLQLKNGVRLRLIGVDTPETVTPQHGEEPWGREATDLPNANRLSLRDL